jgi:hypothetical protein
MVEKIEHVHAIAALAESFDAADALLEPGRFQGRSTLIRVPSVWRFAIRFDGKLTRISFPCDLSRRRGQEESWCLITVNQRALAIQRAGQSPPLRSRSRRRRPPTVRVRHIARSPA